MKIHFEYPFKTNDIFEIKDNFAIFSHVKSNLLFSDCVVDSPEISVVIPTYKNRETIFQAIESVINQEGAPSYEIIVVNNNPEENPDFIDMLHDLNSQKISYYLNEENIGLFGNWNRCVELARSTQIVFLHADDMLCKDALKCLWKYHRLVEKDAALLGYYHIINYNNEIIESHQCMNAIFWGLLNPKKIYKINKWGLFNQDVATGCGAMFNKDVILKIGGWNPDLYPAADACFCMLYQMKSSVYRIDHATSFLKVGYNESISSGKLYASCNYYIRNRIVDLYFRGNKFLKYIVYISCISFSCDFLCISPIKKINIFNRIILKINSTLYRFICYFK